MIALIWFALAVLASPFKSKRRLEAENAVLRHQLIVLQRKVGGRAQLTNNDRWFFVRMYRWFPSILKVVTIVPHHCLRRGAYAPGSKIIRRTQRSLHKDAPISRPIHQTGMIRSQRILGGLHHHYVRV
jgi:hypothetical protein